MDILNIDTMKWKVAHLKKARQWAAGVPVAPRLALFAGGQWCNIGSCNGGWIRDPTVDVYSLDEGKRADGP